MFKGYIYRHWIVNEEGIEKSYIGKTKQKLNRRWGTDGKGYLKDGKGKPSVTKFANAIRKYDWNNFNHEILLVIERSNEQELDFWLNEWEKYYIEKYDSYCNGYNETLGGDGGTGLKGEKNGMYGKVGELSPMYGVHRYGKDNPNYGHYWSEEQKQNASEKHKGRKTSEETKHKQSEAQKERAKKSGYVNSMKGKHHTEEAKQKMSEAHKGEKNGMYGRTHTDEVKQKLSDIRSHSVVCIETGQVFKSVKEAGLWCNLKNKSDIGACIRGRQKTAGKHPITKEPLHWMYYEDYLELQKEKQNTKEKDLVTNEVA